MKDENKTKAELIKELKTLRKERGESALKVLTEYKQIEEKYPSFTKDILDASAVGIFILDSDFKVVWINHLTEKYFGLQREKVIGEDKRKLIKKNIQHIFEDSDEFVRKVFATYDNNTFVENFECRVLPKGKRKERWLKYWSQPIKSGLYAGGRIEYYYDITERKKAEEALRENENLYRTLFEAAGDAIFIIEVTGEGAYFTDCNSRVIEMFGCKTEDLIGKSPADFSPPLQPDGRSSVEKVKEVTQAAIEEPQFFEWSHCRLDGTIFDTEVTLNRIDISGKIHLQAIVRDITERKKAEDALRESETKFREMAELLPEVVYECDAQGNLTFANKVAFEKFGYTQGDFHKGVNMQQFIAPDDKKRAGENIEKIFRGIKRGPFEYIALRKDGSEFPVATYSSPIIRDGKPVGLRGIIIDITERKRAEEALQESEEKIRAIIDASSDVIHLLDINGIILSTNKGYAKRLGLEIDDVVGKCVFDYTPYESIHKRKAAIDKVFRTGEPLQLEDKAAVSVFESHIHPVFNPAGEVTAVAVYARDITEQKQSEERLKKIMDATIETMSKMIEAKDPYTSGHQHRVCQLAVLLAQELGLTEDKIKGIRIASLIHDIGKIGLPTEILSKPTTLTDIEYSLIKGHSQIGYDILKSIDFAYPIARIVLQHHERLNGSGYPNNLKGDEIILEAKIIGVADVVEAMSSFRPYRPALGTDKALEEISKNKDILYDPEVVDACLKIFKEKRFKFES
jgi:PAS domain S-box-containing protein